MHPYARQATKQARSALGAVVVAAFLISASPAVAAAAGRTAAGPTTTTTAPTCPPPGPAGGAAAPALLPGVTIGPGLVVTPGEPNRTLNTDQDTAFIQSWLPASVVQHLPPDAPPATVKVSHIYLTTSYGGSSTCITAWYAVQGAQVWVGMPAQSLGWASVTKDTWIAAPNPAFTVKAFAGKAKPVNTETGSTTTTVAPTTTSGVAAPKSSGSSGSSSWIWFVVAGVIVLAILAWVLVRSRARPRTAG